MIGLNGPGAELLETVSGVHVELRERHSFCHYGKAFSEDGEIDTQNVTSLGNKMLIFSRNKVIANNLWPTLRHYLQRNIID